MVEATHGRHGAVTGEGRRCGRRGRDRPVRDHPTARTSGMSAVCRPPPGERGLTLRQPPSRQAQCRHGRFIMVQRDTVRIDASAPSATDGERAQRRPATRAGRARSGTGAAAPRAPAPALFGHPTQGRIGIGAQQPGLFGKSAGSWSSRAWDGERWGETVRHIPVGSAMRPVACIQGSTGFRPLGRSVNAGSRAHGGGYCHQSAARYTT